MNRLIPLYLILIIAVATIIYGIVLLFKGNGKGGFARIILGVILLGAILTLLSMTPASIAGGV